MLIRLLEGCRGTFFTYFVRYFLQSKRFQSLKFSLGTFLSRISGLLREMVLARTFGGGFLLDAFYVAYRIPHLFRDMLSEGALGSSLSKNYSQAYDSSPTEGTDLALYSFILTFGITSILTSLGILLRGPLVSLMTLYGGGDEAFTEITQTLTAVLFPLMAFSSLGSIFSGMLAKKKVFFLIAVSPALCNIGSLAGVFSGIIWPQTSTHPHPQLLGLAIGTLLGGLAQLLLLAAPNLKQLWKRLGTFSWRRLITLSAPHFRVFKESLPMMMAASVAQLQVIVSTNFATSLEAGAVSWLHLSFRLFQLPVGLFAVAEATVILPALASKIRQSHQSQKEVALTLRDSLTRIFWIMAFCMSVTLAASGDIVTLIYFGGSFDHHDTLMTSRALEAYATGMMGFGLTKVLLSYYYAAEKTQLALALSCGVLVVGTCLSLAVIQSHGHVGLAAVTSIMLSVQAIILGWMIYQKPSKLASKTNRIPVTTVVLALSAVACSLLLCRSPFSLFSTFFGSPITLTSLMAVKTQAFIALIAKSTIILSLFAGFFLLSRRHSRALTHRSLR